MAVKFNMSNRKRDELKALLDPLIAQGVERIAEACNSESSWGGYVATFEPGRGAVHATAKSSRDAARAQRLLRNLDKGRP